MVLLLQRVPVSCATLEGDIMPQQLDDKGLKWRIQVRAGAQRPSEIVNGTVTEARQREAELKAKYGRLKLKKSRGETTGDYLQKWLKRTHHKAVSDATYETYERAIDRVLVRTIGAVVLTKLTSADILDAYQTAADGIDGQVYGPPYLRKCHALLNAALQDAVDDGKIRANPATARRIGQWLKGYRRTTPRRDMRPPALKDVQALLARMQTTKSGRRLYGPCLLALDTGLRRTEFLGLKWADIEVERALIHVQRDVVQTSHHGVIITDTKTLNSDRIVLLTRRAAQYLTDWRDQQNATRERLGNLWSDEDWVFPNTVVHLDSKPGRVWLPVTFSLLLKRETTKLGLPLEAHQLRRLHATIMEHAEVPQTEIAARLGHGSTEVTRDHYLFVVDDGQRAAVEKFEAAIGAADELTAE
jgi:integrase